MNYIKNDKGLFVTAIGAPGSIERVKCEWPGLIERLNDLYDKNKGRPSRNIQKAFKMIRDAGVKSKLEKRSIILASNYLLVSETKSIINCTTYN